MKRAGLIAGLLLLTLTACGGSGPSRSYKLGQYDGPRLAASVTDVSPSGIKSACTTSVADYEARAAQQSQARKLPVNKNLTGTPKRLLDNLDIASTPDFTMHTANLNRSDYLSGCETSLKARLR